MKIAYIGYDLSCVRTNSFFHSKDIKVTYFLTYPNVSPAYETFQNTSVLCDNLMISPINIERTEAQNFYFKKLKNNYNFLQNEVSGSDYGTESNLEKKNNEASEVFVQDMQNIIDIQYDSKNKKVLIEIEKHGVEEYDFIVTEQHLLISLELEKKNIHLFDKKLKTPSIWTSFNYEISYSEKINFQTPKSSFFIVLDSDRESVTDNWLHCFLTKNQLQISSFQPYSQLMNPSFQEFENQRIQQQMAQKIKVFTLKKMTHITLSTVAADYTSSHCLMKPSGAVPNFSFWTDDQMNAFLQKQIMKKINKIILKNKTANSEASL